MIELGEKESCVICVKDKQRGKTNYCWRSALQMPTEKRGAL